MHLLYQVANAWSLLSQRFLSEGCHLKLAQQLIETRMLILRRDIVHDHSTAGARNACCDTFSEIAKYPSQVRAGVIAFVLKSEHKYQYCITVPYLLDCLTTIVDQ